MHDWIRNEQLTRIADALTALAMKNAPEQLEKIREKRRKEENWESF